MKKLFLRLLILTLLIPCFTNAQTPTKIQQDRQAILSMIGCYKVSFNFAETFSPDTNYKYHDRYHSWGIEYVFVIEDTEKKISLQHLLIVNDSTIVKHWRQDWLFENTTLLAYYKDNEWRKTTLKPAQVKGQWTQKVFQVDDSPRYEATGTWNHVDGKHFWEAECDAPLPRREFTKRSDYNVMHRKSRIEITAANGWFLEQDNQKILRSNGIDKLLCNEKGMESFTPGSYNCQVAIDWWSKNKTYWDLVRTVWNDVFNTNNALKFERKIGDSTLWQQLFKLEKEQAKASVDEQKQNIKKAIEDYLKTS